MADERPSAYYEPTDAGGRRLVIRGHALGTCAWELIATLQGFEPQPWPERILRAFKEGEVAEPLILQRLVDIGWVLDDSWTQRTLELSCGTGRIVRLHPDGAGCPATQPTTPHAIEAKALHNSTWQSFRRHGVRGIGHGYDWQFSAEMAAARMPLAVVALNKGETPDENGKRPECADEGQLHFEFLNDPPHSRADILKRVRMIAEAADGDNVVQSGRPCDNPQQWPCRFYHLRPEPEKDQGYAVDPAEADEYERYCRAYDTAKRLENRAKTMKEGARDALLKLAGNRDEMFTDLFELTVVGGENTKTDWAAMRAAGVDVEQYQTKEPKSKSVRVTRR